MTTTDLNGEPNSKFFYSHNVDVRESVTRHAIREELLTRCGYEARVGPAWDESQRRFVDAPKSVGVFVYDGADLRDLGTALKQVKSHASLEAALQETHPVKTGIPCIDN